MLIISMKEVYLNIINGKAQFHKLISFNIEDYSLYAFYQ